MKKLTDNMKQELNGVWQHIGGDILTALEEQGETPTLPRSEVADLILDWLGMAPNVSKETIAFIDDIDDFDEKIKTIETCLSFESYGW